MHWAMHVYCSRQTIKCFDKHLQRSHWELHSGSLHCTSWLQFPHRLQRWSLHWIVWRLLKGRYRLVDSWNVLQVSMQLSLWKSTNSCSDSSKRNFSGSLRIYIEFNLQPHLCLCQLHQGRAVLRGDQAVFGRLWMRSNNQRASPSKQSCQHRSSDFVSGCFRSPEVL